ncbi:Bug family tripartite tricarboxylate transporter substrate binding protein [Polynucleobacter rarus]|jgi:tripartite-type tricarboxylate transporter receptor subunit TctC|uniref:Bug family tripartite tricarboxylate transporter substrate binding protein n=1 Tax=Polynucleobacter rarus TaxID=556055 RepID=UPI000D3E313B|nr:tripartite tricarboxylate transporter substrate binding protein [Polynucleobacter rarus]
MIYKFILLLLLSNFSFNLFAQSAASSYPNRTIKVIVPYVAGGAADITARVICQKLSENLGQSIVVENQPGANGMIGTAMVAKAPPDGYTLVVAASGPIVIAPALYPQMTYDPMKDLAPVSNLTVFQYAVAVRQESPIKDMKDLINLAKANPGTLSYGSTGIGGGGHLAGVRLEQVSGTKLIHVPYKGGAAIWTDLLGGQLSFTFEAVVTALPMVKSNKMRVFAVTSAKRATNLPNVPTLAELGFKDYDISQFQGMFAPGKTDPMIIQKLQTEIAKVVKNPEIIKRLVNDGGNELIGNTPEEFSAQIKSELAMYTKLIKENSIKAE